MQNLTNCACAGQKGDKGADGSVVYVNGTNGGIVSSTAKGEKGERGPRGKKGKQVMKSFVFDREMHNISKIHSRVQWVHQVVQQPRVTLVFPAIP